MLREGGEGGICGEGRCVLREGGRVVFVERGGVC